MDELKSSLFADFGRDANSYDPEVRAICREVIGMPSHTEVPLNEERFELAKKAIEGDAEALSKVARIICNENEEANGGETWVNSETLIIMESICHISYHHLSFSADVEVHPTGTQVSEALDAIDLESASALKDEIKEISEKSPFSSVREAAEDLLRELEE